MNTKISTLSLDDLKIFNANVHAYHNFVSAYTYYKRYSLENNRELADAYYNYCKRLNEELTEDWRQEIL